MVAFVKVLTKENASELLGGKPLDAFVNQLASRLQMVGEPYSIPRDSGRKTALSRAGGPYLDITPHPMSRNTSETWGTPAPRLHISISTNSYAAGGRILITRMLVWLIFTGPASPYR